MTTNIVYAKITQTNRVGGQAFEYNTRKWSRDGELPVARKMVTFAICPSHPAVFNYYMLPLLWEHFLGE